MRAYFSSNSIIHALSSISKKSAYSKIVLYNERSRNPTDQSLISASTNKHSSRHDIFYNNNQNRQLQFLIYFMDMSDAEIGELMNVVRTTVYRHRTSTLEELRKMMEEE